MLVLSDEKLGPHDPITSTPDRRPESIRRTTTIDVSWPDGYDDVSRITARGRDLLTTDAGEALVVASVELRLRAAPFGEIDEALSPDGATDLGPLVGVAMGPGFRRRMAEAMSDIDVRPQDPTHLLLDDLAGVTLVSGYGMMRAGALGDGKIDPDVYGQRSGICAGWVGDGVMFDAIREHERVPMPVGPPSPTLERDDDRLSWHDLPNLPPGSIRRRRRLDVDRDGRIDAMFRDSHVDGEGAETNLHEYSLSARVDPAAHTMLEIDVRAHVLPWVECPRALASAQRVVGMRVTEIRDQVTAAFRGPSTCTHLNDMLRSLTDIVTLLSHL